MHTHGGELHDAVQTEDTSVMGGDLEHSDFRNLFGPVYGTERLSADSYGGGARCRALMEKLAQRMSVTEYGPGTASENPRIPAGYTYLGQLAAHDLVHTLDGAPGPSGLPTHRCNARHRRLVLDTLYGGGPQHWPIAYALAEDGVGERALLRLGRVVERGGSRSNVPKFAPALDLPRVSCPHLNDDPGGEHHDALICDPRNDDNLIISQLTVAFTLFHNAVYRQLRRSDQLSPTSRRNGTVPNVFYRARKLVTKVFRTIIRDDYLRDRVLHPLARDFYCSSSGAQLLDPCDDGRLPIEFAHGALRFGHAMVRSDYRVNDRLARERGGRNIPLREILLLNSQDKPGETPISAEWLVQWGHFFEIDGSTPTPSRRLAPSMVPRLVTSRSINTPATRNGGLAYRDLMRATEGGLRTVRSLIDHLPAQFKHDVPLLADEAFRERAILAWLTSKRSFSLADATQIASNPPLPFFVLFEAMFLAKGESLGPLGSAIIGEVFFREFSRQDHEFETPQTQSDADAVFPDGIPGSMPSLLLFVGEQRKGEVVLPSFI